MRYQIQYSYLDVPQPPAWTFDPVDQSQRHWSSVEFEKFPFGVRTPEQLLDYWLAMGTYGTTVVMVQE